MLITWITLTILPPDTTLQGIMLRHTIRAMRRTRTAEPVIAPLEAAPPGIEQLPIMQRAMLHIASLAAAEPAGTIIHPVGMQPDTIVAILTLNRDWDVAIGHLHHVLSDGRDDAHRTIFC
jgi:hypothetical protein